MFSKMCTADVLQKLILLSVRKIVKGVMVVSGSICEFNWMNVIICKQSCQSQWKRWKIINNNAFNHLLWPKDLLCWFQNE